MKKKLTETSILVIEKISQKSPQKHEFTSMFVSTLFPFFFISDPLKD